MTNDERSLLGGELLGESYALAKPTAKEKAAKLRRLADELERFEDGELGGVVCIWTTYEAHPNGEAGSRVYCDGFIRSEDWPYVIDAILSAAGAQIKAEDKLNTVQQAEEHLNRAARRRRDQGKP